MDTRITTGTFLALALSVVLGYAAPQLQPQPPQTQTASRPNAAQRPAPAVGSAPIARPSVVGANKDSKETSTATVTGCVQPGAGPRTYVLAESPSALAPAGTATQPPQARDRGTRYELFSDATIDLSKLVGRQVEASGTVSKPAVSSDEKKSTTRPDALPTFTAKSLRETGSSC